MNTGYKMGPIDWEQNLQVVLSASSNPATFILSLSRLFTKSFLIGLSKELPNIKFREVKNN